MAENQQISVIFAGNSFEVSFFLLDSEAFFKNSINNKYIYKDLKKDQLQNIQKKRKSVLTQFW